jgi:hypothetical protein
MRKRNVLPEVLEVRRVASGLDGRKRWPKEVTRQLVHRLRDAGLVPAAIADELQVTDRCVLRLLREP